MKPIDLLEQTVRDIALNIVMPSYLKVDSARKSDGSMLSKTDLASQRALQERLPEIIDAPVLGEEMTYEQQQQLWLHSQNGLWVCDPIDGTNNFVCGIPHFAVSVGYIKDGRTQLGVVFNPVTGECFSAERHHGAFFNGNRLPTRHTNKTLLREAVVGLDVKRLRSAKLVSSINNFSPFGALRCMGSSTLDWCFVAAARYDIYLHGGQNLWDYAAGALIAEEAGVLIDTLEGDDFWSGAHTFQRSVIAARDPELFIQWRNWIRKNQ